MKVAYLCGTDWAALTVDSVARYEGHKIRDVDFLAILREAGVEVETPKGNFCSGCGCWIPGAPFNDDQHCQGCRQ